MTVSPDPSKLIYYSGYGAFKNYRTESASRIATTGQVDVPFIFSVGVTMNIIATAMVNFSGGPNDSTRWYPANSQPSLGQYQIGGLTYSFVVVYLFNTGSNLGKLTVGFYPSIAGAFDAPITITVRAASFIGPFDDLPT